MLPGAVCTECEPPKGAEKYEPYFDAATAELAERWITEFCRFTDDKWAGRPFVLEWWQAAIVRQVFGWRRADGTRLFREVYIEIPRKNGKTEFMAAIALLMLIADGVFGGQVYSAAVDGNQAKIVFNKAQAMISFSPALRDSADLFKTSIFVPRLMSRFEPLSSNAKSKHGFSPSAALYDEIHEWRDGELADVIHKGTAARSQPLEVYATTAGQRGRGFGWEKHQYAEQVRDGVIEDPTFLPVIFAADPDSDDWTDPATWEKANPNLGVSIRRDYLETECAKAQHSNRLEADFKRFHLNIWVESAVRWIRLNQWDQCVGPVRWQDLWSHLAGRRCFAGGDLSTKKDLTSLVFVFPPAAGDPWFVVPRFFVPEQTLIDRVESDRVPYDVWRDQGAIDVTPGNTIDMAFVEEVLRQAARDFELIDCAYDPWNAHEFAVRMTGEGLQMVEFRQGPRTFSEPMKKFEQNVIDAALAHGGHPVLRWNAANCAIRSDPNGNIAPDKVTSTERIDGIVASCMAFGRAVLHEPVFEIEIPEDYEVPVL